MKKQPIIFNNEECKAVRVDFYLKRGEYAHGNVKGWELVRVSDGKIVLSGEPGRARSAYEYQQPLYRTRKELMEAIDDHKRMMRGIARRKAAAVADND